MGWVTPAAKSQKPLLLENNWPSASAVLPALIRRKDLDGQVAIKINVANRLLLNWKQIGSHRLDFDRVQLARRKIHCRFGQAYLEVAFEPWGVFAFAAWRPLDRRTAAAIATTLATVMTAAAAFLLGSKECFIRDFSRINGLK